MEPFDPTADFETEYERVYHYVLDSFETSSNNDGESRPIEAFYGTLPGMSRTEVREWAYWLADQKDALLVIGREAGLRVIIYRPFRRYLKRLNDCHENASSDGTVPPKLVKLLLQEFVVLNQPQRDALLKDLVSDHARAVKAGTMRRAQVDTLLHDSLITFRVAPERS